MWLCSADIAEYSSSVSIDYNQDTRARQLIPIHAKGWNKGQKNSNSIEKVERAF